MAFHVGRVAGKHLVTLMSNSSFPLTAACFCHLCDHSRFHRLDAVRPRLSLKHLAPLTSYCGFLQPATHPLPPGTSHPFPHPWGFGCALMLLLLPWSDPSLEQAGPVCLCLQKHHMKPKAFSCHLSTCNVHFSLLCEEPRECWILYCCHHLGLAQICHLAEVSLL